MKNFVKNFVFTLAFVIFGSLACQAQFIDSCSSCRNIEATEEAQDPKGNSSSEPFLVIVKLFENTVLEIYSNDLGTDLDNLSLPTNIYTVEIYRKQDLFFTLDLYKE